MIIIIIVYQFQLILTSSKKNILNNISYIGFVALLIYEIFQIYTTKRDLLQLSQNLNFNLAHFLICCCVFAAIILLNKDKDLVAEETIPILKQKKSTAYFDGLFTFWKHLPWFINAGILLLSVLMGLLCFFDLGYFDILPDETLHIEAAKGFNETGSFKRWDFLLNKTGEPYDRAWSYTFLISIVYKFFGVSVENARLVSALFGILFVPLIFRISMYFTKSYTASLLTTLAVLFCPYFLVYFRRIRMYSMLLPVFALFYYFAIRVLNEPSGRNKLFGSVLLGKLLDFKMPLLGVTLFFLFLSFNVHQLSLLSLVALFIYFIYLVILQKSLRLMTIFGLGVIILILIMIKPEVSGGLENKFSFFKENNQIYLTFLLKPLFSINFTLAVFTSGFLFIFKNENKQMLAALYAMVLSTICLFVYCIQYDIHFRYISYTMPFFYILMFSLLSIYNEKAAPKYFSFVLPLACLTVIVLNFVNSKESIYYKNPEAQFTEKVYRTMKRQFDPKTQQILALFPEEFYLDEMAPNTPLIAMPKDKELGLGQLNFLLSKKQSTWVTWPTHKSRHMRQEVIEKINNTCQKYHGYAIDNTFVELYLCTR